MNIQFFSDFFMWCTIINGGLLVLWALIYRVAPDLVYRLQFKWFPIPREKFNIIMYGYLAIFKILYVIFNLVPFLVFLILR